MLRYLLLIVVLSLLAGVAAAAAPLDPHTTVLPVYWLPGDAKADGELAKWKGIPPAVTPEQFKLNETDTLLTPSDEFAPTVYFGRRRGSTDLFFLVVVKDRCVLPAESAGWVFGDCMELYLDFGRGARVAVNPAWWKDDNKWNNAPGMGQFGFLPQTPGAPGKVYRAANGHDWHIDYASMPVRGGFVYEVRVDGESVLRDLKLNALPAQIGVDFLLRAVDYPVILDGAGWANHRGFVRLFGNWMTFFNPTVYGGLATEAREPQGDALPAASLSSLYGASPSLDTLRAALRAGRRGDDLADLLYWTAFQGQMIDAALVRQLLANDSPRVREVCLQLMLDHDQEHAARKAAVELAYRHSASATPLELTAANLLQQELGKGHGTELLRQLSHEDLTVALTAASALAATGTRRELAAFQAQYQAMQAALAKNPAKKQRQAVLHAFMEPAVESLAFRVTPPPVPTPTPVRTLEKNNTDLPRVFAADNNTVYNGAGLLRAWPQDGPKELWRYEIGGGWVAVTEAGGRTYAIGLKDKPIAYCFDAASGKLRWQQVLSTHNPGNIAASPLLDGTERVYYSLPDCVLCLNAADGSLVWREEKAYSGAAFSSPLLAGELLIVPGSTLLAVDKLTGKERWRLKGPAVSPASPALQVVDGVAQIIQGVGTLDTAEVWGISLQDGEVFWKYPVRGDNGLCSSPVVDGSRVLLSFGETGRECFTALQMTVKDGTIRAFPAVIHPGVQGNYAHTMSVYHGLVFGYGGGGLECDNAVSGDTCWRSRKDWSTNLQLIVADNLLFIENGKELVLADADKRAYHELSRFTLPITPSSQQPTLANGRLYIRGESWIMCYSVK